jgi:hypothetical protein
MTIRATRNALMTTTGLQGDARVSKLIFATLTATASDTRVTKVHTATLTATTSDTRVTTIHRFTVASIHNAFVPNLLDSQAEIYGVTGYEIGVTSFSPPESNPYKPTVPESLAAIDPELHELSRENQETLREQHNITQAGDTTFPFQLFTLTHSVKLYNLGSISKFYHDEYGLIHARYVQFDLIDPDTNAGCPMGLIFKHGTLDWVVTNRLEASHPLLVVGVNAAFTLPKDKDYGWVICDGPNLQQIVNDSAGAELGEGFSWSSNGRVSNVASGLVLGRRLNKTNERLIDVGQMYIKLESLSAKSVIDELSVFIAGLTSDIEELKDDVTALKAASNIEDTLRSISRTLTALTTRIANEERGRRTADTSINNRISNLDFVTAGQLGNAVSALQNSLEALRQTLLGRITASNELANQALTAANQALAIVSGGLQEQITQILENLAAEISRPKGKFPVVDGSIPPNLVYMDDGSLVYMETY